MAMVWVEEDKKVSFICCGLVVLSAGLVTLRKDLKRKFVISNLCLRAYASHRLPKFNQNSVACESSDLDMIGQLRM